MTKMKVLRFLIFVSLTLLQVIGANNWDSIYLTPNSEELDTGEIINLPEKTCCDSEDLSENTIEETGTEEENESQDEVKVNSEYSLSEVEANELNIESVVNLATGDSLLKNKEKNLDDNSSYSIKINDYVLDSQPKVTVNSPDASLILNPRGNAAQEKITEEINYQSMPNESQAEASAKDEEMPSFSEWSEKMLQAEKAKNGTAKASSAQRNGVKMRLSNYASLSCGAKTIAANPEAENLKAILDSSYDDYMLSPCSSKSWFVVELCQTIQPQKIEIANFELFSSGFKDFRLLISDRYPAKEWVVLGSFSALDQRQEQSFDVEGEHFGKFLKVEVLSHFGNEHYCPITLFRVFGTSEFEVLEKDHNEDEDFSTAEEMLEDLTDNKTPSISVKDTVINIVKIAVGKVAGTKATNQSTAEAPLSGETVGLGIEVETPTYNCDSQSDFFEFYLKLFKNTQICKSYGFDSSGVVCCESKSTTYSFYIATMLGPKIMKCFCDYYLQRTTKSPVFICPSNVSSPRKEFDNISIDPIQSEMLHLIDIPDAKPTKDSEEILEQGSDKTPKTIEKLLSEINDVTIDVVSSTEKPLAESQSMSQTKVNADSNVTVGIGSQQKETVFVRLSNKLRTLEKNMTLSVEYLEKLSKVYKRKVEDLQKALNQTTGLVTVMGEQLNLLEENYKGDIAVVKKNQEMLQKSLNTLWLVIKVSILVLIFVISIFFCRVRKGLGLKLETEGKQQSLIISSGQSGNAIDRQKYSSLANSASNGRRVFYIPLFESSAEKTAETKTISIDDLGSCEKSLSGRVSSHSSQKKRRNSKS